MSEPFDPDWKIEMDDPTFRGLSHIVEVWREQPTIERVMCPPALVDILNRADRYMKWIEDQDHPAKGSNE